MLLNVGGNTLDVNMKTTAILLFLLSGCSYSKMARSCDGTAGHTALYSNNESLAYELLKNCSIDAAMTGEAVHDLAGLIFYGHGKYSSIDERVTHSLKLWCKAALKGYSTSVFILASHYEQGDKTVNIKESRLVSECLFGLQKNDLEYVSPLDVQACLSLNPDIDPTYECY